MQAVTASRVADLRAGIAVELATIAWMLIEAGIALGVGFASRSLSLQAFGVDSVIELVAGGVLLRRLVLEWRARRRSAVADEERIERAERRASRLVGWALYALAAYVVLDVALSLLIHSSAERAPAGIVLAAAALVVMPALVYAKRRIADAIGSAALRADAARRVGAYGALRLVVGGCARRTGTALVYRPRGARGVGEGRRPRRVLSLAAGPAG